jgi:hypothetical protein
MSDADKHSLPKSFPPDVIGDCTAERFLKRYSVVADEFLTQDADFGEPRP